MSDNWEALKQRLEQKEAHRPKGDEKLLQIVEEAIDHSLATRPASMTPSPILPKPTKTWEETMILLEDARRKIQRGEV